MVSCTNHNISIGDAGRWSGRLDVVVGGLPIDCLSGTGNSSRSHQGDWSRESKAENFENWYRATCFSFLLPGHVWGDIGYTTILLQLFKFNTKTALIEDDDLRTATFERFIICISVNNVELRACVAGETGAEFTMCVVRSTCWPSCLRRFGCVCVGRLAGRHPFCLCCLNISSRETAAECRRLLCICVCGCWCGCVWCTGCGAKTDRKLWQITFIHTHGLSLSAYGPSFACGEQTPQTCRSCAASTGDGGPPAGFVRNMCVCVWYIVFGVPHTHTDWRN